MNPNVGKVFGFFVFKPVPMLSTPQPNV